jgi:DNA-binding NtrC family response regulator
LDQANRVVEVAHELVLGVSQPHSGQAEASGTILLVEDESFVREVTRQVLEAAGFRVIEAQTASEAKKIFCREPGKPDLLITDVVLPDRNGRDLSEELTDRCPELKTIFVSGYPENVVTRTTPNCGTFYLAKPFSRESLLGVVRQALAEAGTRGV